MQLALSGVTFIKTRKLVTSCRLSQTKSECVHLRNVKVSVCLLVQLAVRGAVTSRCASPPTRPTNWSKLIQRLLFGVYV